MMPLQIVDGIPLYIVVLPENPISLLPIRYDDPIEKLYANALEIAIREGIVTEAGKYGIHIDFANNNWTIHKIIED